MSGEENGIEILFGDLIPEKQREILDKLGDNGNFDIYPIATIPVGELEETLTQDDMTAYGYAWGGMEPLDRAAALTRFDSSKEVYLLYPDNTEAAAESREEIEKYGGTRKIRRWASSDERAARATE
ncbi:MAG: hypothetical protein LBT26_06310 [Clostridiales Family XIII bacterium]|jgi:hypothetical protein|nr:hypothetical protein [Clostridiales Family XIII bacterium]